MVGLSVTYSHLGSVLWAAHQTRLMMMMKMMMMMMMIMMMIMMMMMTTIIDYDCECSYSIDNDDGILAVM